MNEEIAADTLPAIIESRELTGSTGPLKDVMGTVLRPWCRIQLNARKTNEMLSVYVRTEDVMEHIAKGRQNGKCWDETLWGEESLEKGMTGFNEILQISAGVPWLEIPRDLMLWTSAMSSDYDPQVNNICETVILRLGKGDISEITFLPRNLDTRRALAVRSLAEVVAISDDSDDLRHYRKDQVIEKMLKGDWTGIIVKGRALYFPLFQQDSEDTMDPDDFKVPTPIEALEKILEKLEPVSIPHPSGESMTLEEYMEESGDRDLNLSGGKRKREGHSVYHSEDVVSVGKDGKVSWFGHIRHRILISPRESSTSQKAREKNLSAWRNPGKKFRKKKNRTDA